jgi:hypothetical protein
MRRLYALEAGFFTNHLLQGSSNPDQLSRSEFNNGVDIADDQHRAYSLAFSFNRYTRQSNIAATFLRFRAQAERIYRRAVEDLHRLLKFHELLGPKK